MNQDELMHSGVKGMRWGVRKARPSSGSGGKKSGKANLTSAQKKKIRAQAKAEAERIKKTRLADLEKRRNAAAKRAADKAEKSVFGVGMSKVPGKLDFYRARVKKNGFINEDGTFEDDYKISHVSPKVLAQRTAYFTLIAGGLASPFVAKAISNRN